MVVRLSPLSSAATTAAAADASSVAVLGRLILRMEVRLGMIQYNYNINMDRGSSWIVYGRWTAQVQQPSDIVSLFAVVYLIGD